MDRHAEVLEGHWRATRQRPPAWSGINNVPRPGCWCSCCHGGRWVVRRSKRLGLALLDVLSARTSCRQAGRDANVSRILSRVDGSQTEIAIPRNRTS
jgi:hypothetical protein